MFSLIKALKLLLPFQRIQIFLKVYFFFSAYLHVDSYSRFIHSFIYFFFFQISRCSINIDLVKDNFSELRGTIAGPPDTPYEGGTFHVEIKVPETYPFNPPKVKFLTKIWHPNISSATGAICLDILKDQW